MPFLGFLSKTVTRFLQNDVWQDPGPWACLFLTNKSTTFSEPFALLHKQSPKPLRPEGLWFEAGKQFSRMTVKLHVSEDRKDRDELEPKPRQPLCACSTSGVLERPWVGKKKKKKQLFSLFFYVIAKACSFNATGLFSRIHRTKLIGKEETWSTGGPTWGKTSEVERHMLF